MADLQTHLTAARDHHVSPRHPAPDIEAVAQDVARETLVAKKAELERVKARCHVSRVYLGFIDHVLGSMA